MDLPVRNGGKDLEFCSTCRLARPCDLVRGARRGSRPDGDPRQVVLVLPGRGQAGQLRAEQEVAQPVGLQEEEGADIMNDSKDRRCRGGQTQRHCVKSEQACSRHVLLGRMRADAVSCSSF